MSRAAPLHVCKTHLLVKGRYRCNCAGEVKGSENVGEVTCGMCLNLHAHGVNYPPLRGR